MLPTGNRGRSWSWSYSSWIYNYICTQCIFPLTLLFQIPLRQCVLDTTLCDKVFQWHAAGRWYSGYSSTSTNKTDRHDITVILLKVALNTITPTPQPLEIKYPVCYKMHWEITNLKWNKIKLMFWIKNQNYRRRCPDL